MTFWDGSTFRAFGPITITGKEKPVISKPTQEPPDTIKFPGLGGPKADLRWIIGPDGTRYANNVSHLFMLRPVCVNDPNDVPLAQDKLTYTHQTVLARSKVTVSSPLDIASGKDLIVESADGFKVTTGSKFSVKQGAAVSIRIAKDLKP